MEDFLLYFLIGMFGANIANKIKNKEVELPSITISVIIFVILQFVIILMMLARAASVYLSSRVFSYATINYEAAFVYPFLFSAAVFLVIVVIRFIERRTS